jgi:hypothetical protein
MMTYPIDVMTYFKSPVHSDFENVKILILAAKAADIFEKE